MRLFNIIAFTLCMIVAVLDALCGKIPLAIWLLVLGSYNLYWVIRG